MSNDHTPEQKSCGGAAPSAKDAEDAALILSVAAERAPEGLASWKGDVDQVVARAIASRKRSLH